MDIMEYFLISSSGRFFRGTREEWNGRRKSGKKGSLCSRVRTVNAHSGHGRYDSPTNISIPLSNLIPNPFSTLIRLTFNSVPGLDYVDSSDPLSVRSRSQVPSQYCFLFRFRI
ncbi:hypothetical protein EVAR_5333_1 [Eumeta japonica]|uniref:Uncharacterized protein n=1 Tax=Eumeta variegata TaxID=151549 RepID=A0A4C1TM33_EUMVA|nr:hypothetical protein EVAR_5333_1 [Eumeta japonica]